LLQASIPIGPYLVPPDVIYRDGAGAASPPPIPARAVIAGMVAALGELGFGPDEG
jgi:hypothetical protein